MCTSSWKVITYWLLVIKLYSINLAEANTNKQFVDTDQIFVMRFELSDLDIDPDLGALALAIIGSRSILNYVD